MKKILGLFLAILITSTASATVVLDFIIDGDTFYQDYQLSNSSTAGEQVTSFVMDLRPLTTYCYHIIGVGCNGSGHVAFSATGGTGITTGLSSALVTDEAGGLAFFDYLEMDFSHFDAGESFTWEIDMDSLAGSTVYGNELIGATAFADLTDGNRYFGVFEAVSGNPDASIFNITGSTTIPTVPEPTSLALLGLGLAGFGFARKKKNI